LKTGRNRSICKEKGDFIMLKSGEDALTDLLTVVNDRKIIETPDFLT